MLENGLNLDIERLFSKINSAQKKLDILKKTSNNRTEEIIELEVEIRVLKEEVDAKNESITEFKKIFKEQLFSLYKKSLDLENSKKAFSKIYKKINLFQLITFTLLITINGFLLLTGNFSVGITSLFLIALIVFVEFARLAFIEKEDSYPLMLKRDLETKFPKGLDNEILKKMFPENAFLKETKLSIKDDFHKFTTEFLKNL